MNVHHLAHKSWLDFRAILICDAKWQSWVFRAAVIRMENILYFYYCQKKKNNQKGKMSLCTFQLSCTAWGTTLRACFLPLKMWTIESSTSCTWMVLVDLVCSSKVQERQLRYLIAVRIQRQVQLWDSNKSCDTVQLYGFIYPSTASNWPPCSPMCNPMCKPFSFQMFHFPHAC